MTARTLLISLFSVLLSLACTQRGATDSSTVIFTDDFNRADEDLADSSNWAVTPPNSTLFQIRNEQAYPRPNSSGTVQGWYRTFISGASGVSMKVNVSGGTMVPTYEFYIGLLKDSLVYGTSTGSFFCGIANGVPVISKNLSIVVTGVTTHTFSNGMERTLTATIADNVFTCTLGGPTTETISYTNATTIHGGYFGFIGNDPNALQYLRFDDFTVY